MPRAPWLLFLLKAAICAVVALRTEVPGRDAATYLWMAEEAARGNGGALFATVFHPLYPALVALLLRAAPGLDPVAAGQWVACGTASLAVFPVWAVARSLYGERAAAWAGLCYALGAWFARHPAECLSEGPFLLFVLLWAWALVRGRRLPVLAGAAAALAYLCRPEGLLLVPLGAVWLWSNGARAPAVELLLGALPIAALLPAGYALHGEGFTLTPKAAFNWGVGAGDPEDGGLLHVLREAAALPGAAFEQLGYLILPLCVYGAWLHRPRGRGDPGWLLLLPLLLLCALLPLVRAHWRFLAGFGVLWLPFAGVAAATVSAALGRRGTAAALVLPLLVLGSETRVFKARNQERAIERDLGRYLGARLRPGETLASDMPRLAYFAGQRPPEPRPIPAAELVQAAGSPRCRILAWVRGRTDPDPQELSRLGLEPLDLPALLSAAAGRRGVLVYAKRPPR